MTGTRRVACSIPARAARRGGDCWPAAKPPADSKRVAQGSWRRAKNNAASPGGRVPDSRDGPIWRKPKPNQRPLHCTRSEPFSQPFSRIVSISKYLDYRNLRRFAQVQCLRWRQFANPNSERKSRRNPSIGVKPFRRLYEKICPLSAAQLRSLRGDFASQHHRFRLPPDHHRRPARPSGLR